MMKMEDIEFKPGTLLAGRYLLQEHLGRGGMGTVWLAKDEELDDLPVATKLLLPELANDVEFITSLKEEAKSSMNLSHPNIVRVFNLHRDEKNKGVAFLVLKYVKGGTMKEVLQDWPQGVPFERMMRWAKQLASALDYAHANGVIHRDIKPSNIMIDAETDSAMLMDFGISRQCDQTLRTGSASSGTGLGTLAYMSPQQLHDKDCKSNDIYSLAATLYQAVSGRAPFIGADIEEKILRAQPEPIEGISDVVNRALLAGLAKGEEDRPGSAEDLIDMMGLRHPPPPPPSPRFPFMKLTVAALVIGGAGLLAYNQGVLGLKEDAVVVNPVISGGGEQVVGGLGAAESGLSELERLNEGGVVNDPPSVSDGQTSGGSTNPTPAQTTAIADENDGHTEEVVSLDDDTMSYFELIRRGDVGVVQAAIDKARAEDNLDEVFEKIDPNTGYRLIHTAAATGRVDVVAELIAAGASVETQGALPREVRPLHVAVERGHQGVVKTLLESGADISASDGGGSTALHLAAVRCRSQRDYDLILLLLGSGAEKNVHDVHGQTPASLVPITSAFHDAAKEALK